MNRKLKIDKVIKKDLMSLNRFLKGRSRAISEYAKTEDGISKVMHLTTVSNDLMRCVNELDRIVKKIEIKALEK